MTAGVLATGASLAGSVGSSVTVSGLASSAALASSEGFAASSAAPSAGLSSALSAGFSAALPLFYLSCQQAYLLEGYDLNFFFTHLDGSTELGEGVGALRLLSVRGSGTLLNSSGAGGAGRVLLAQGEGEGRLALVALDLLLLTVDGGGGLRGLRGHVGGTGNLGAQGLDGVGLGDDRGILRDRRSVLGRGGGGLLNLLLAERQTTEQAVDMSVM